MFRSRTFIIAGLLLCSTFVMICEGKTYSKKLNIVQLGKNDQVIVQKSGTNKMVAQYFCHEGNCSSDPVGCLKMESGYLLLIMDNVNHSDRFDAFQNLKKEILLNFTLDEEAPSTSYSTGNNESQSDTIAAGVSVPIICLLIICFILYQKVKCFRKVIRGFFSRLQRNKENPIQEQDTEKGENKNFL